jgi:hypothetical protein
MCSNCTTSGETCDTQVFPPACQTCPNTYQGCPGGTQTTTAQSFAGACSASDLADAAAACQGGAATPECQAFIDGEFNINPNCGECMNQFDTDFVNLTGIYACASGFLSCSCNVDTGCAANCSETVCQSCSEDPTCQSSADSTTGVCGTQITSANSCITSDSQANTLCSSSNYANFGAWFAAVGQAYCQTGVTPVCDEGPPDGGILPPGTGVGSGGSARMSHASGVSAAR